MIELDAPDTVHLGEPFAFRYTAPQRVSGRLRLTSGTDALPFTLSSGDGEPVHGSAPRIRGREGSYQISDWGEPPVGSELVLRFEGAKRWIRVAGRRVDREG